MGKIMKAIVDLISHIGNKSNPHGVTAAQVGAAPDGYGLGKQTPPLMEDANAITPARFFRVTSSTANVGGASHYGGIVLPYSPSEAIQMHARTTSGAVRFRRTDDGGETWESDWLNPGMAVGTEYQTVERYEGKTVYCALVQLALPAVTTASASTDLTVPHGMNVKTLVRASANLGGSQILPYISDNKSYSLKGIATDNAIFRVCNTTYGATTANVLMYYTKE
jgi:hypothetical protein